MRGTRIRAAGKRRRRERKDDDSGMRMVVVREGGKGENGALRQGCDDGRVGCDRPCGTGVFGGFFRYALVCARVPPSTPIVRCVPLDRVSPHSTGTRASQPAPLVPFSRSTCTCFLYPTAEGG